jgi:hypothetical protein
MGPSVNVRAIEALGELRGSLSQFSGEAQVAFDAAGLEIRRTLDWLQERQGHWRNELPKRQAKVEQARSALERCKASEYRDEQGHSHSANCSDYEQALLQAQVRLREAEAELSNVQQWMQLTQQAVGSYQSQAQRLGSFVTSEIPRAAALLSSKMTALQAYAGEVSITAANDGGEAGPTASLSSEPISGNDTSIGERRGITWKEHQEIVEKWRNEGITLEEMKRLGLPISDLQVGSVQEDSSWIYQILESEAWRDMLKDSQEADRLRDAILATLKAMNYRRSNP